MALFAVACQDNDIDRSDMTVAAPDAASITGQLQGDDYTWQWAALPARERLKVTIYRIGPLHTTELAPLNNNTHKSVPTNVPYE